MKRFTQNLAFGSTLVFVCLGLGCQSSDRSNGQRQGHGDKSVSEAQAAEKELAHLINTGSKDAKSALPETKAEGTESSRDPASKRTGSVYIVQAGAFKVKENAEKFQARLKADGFPVIMRPMEHSKNGSLYVVRMEPTTNRTEAEALKKALKEKVSVEGHIIKRPEYQ